MTQPSPAHTPATYLPPATHIRSGDGAPYCPHAKPVAPGSCEGCWELHEAACPPCWERRLARLTQPSPADQRPPCDVNSCEKPRRRPSSLHCSMHETRLLRTGSLERTIVSPIDRFFTKVRQDGECWVWAGQSTGGYGTFAIGERRLRAHRWLYEQMRSEIPEGLHLDHLCRVTLCVNPWHMEPVTNRVNVLRGTSPLALQAARKACVHGHEFTEENTRVDWRGHRNCRTCSRVKSARRQAKKMEGTS